MTTDPCRWGAFVISPEGKRFDMPCRKEAGHAGNHVSHNGDHQWNTATDYEADDLPAKTPFPTPTEEQK